MGRRHDGHKFMPGLFVFPGGRVDSHDGSVPAARELHPVVEDKIFRQFARQAVSASGPRTRTGRDPRNLRRSRTVCSGEKRWGDLLPNIPTGRRSAIWVVTPTLDPLRLVARAITPPGRTRRFDAWFFVTQASHIAHRLEQRPTDELQDLHWLTIESALQLELPVITVTVLKDLETRLLKDPTLKPTSSLPFYHLKGKNFLRDLI